MKSIDRRIQRLERRLLPEPETESSRRLLARLEAGRRRVREMYGDNELDDLLPNETMQDISNGPDMIIDMLNRGRQLARLRNSQPTTANHEATHRPDDFPAKIEE
jgi:hypothetical protein